VLWVIAHIHTFLCGSRPKTQGKPPKNPGRQPNNPESPLTEEQALACLKQMLQAIEDFVVAHRNGTLPPEEQAAGAEPPAAPCPAPPETQAETTPETPAAQTTPQPPAKVAPPPRRQTRKHPPTRRPATQPNPRRRAAAHPNLLCLQKIADIRPTPNHDHFITLL
jgi:hypothetical protein